MEAIITVIIVLLVCIVIWYISTSNGIKRSQLKVEEAESGIDVALTKRYDVLTKMLDVVKGYQAHEKTVLTELVKLRSGMTMVFSESSLFHGFINEDTCCHGHVQ